MNNPFKDFTIFVGDEGKRIVWRTEIYFFEGEEEHERQRARQERTDQFR